jgi:hypothetical protein
MKLCEILYRHLQEEAQRLGWSNRLLKLPSVESPGKPEREEALGLVAGLYPIILVQLGNELDAARANWAEAQRLAANARTSVVADSGEDLVLILVGPADSKDNADWQALAMEIERNDLVCRKLVWLPPKKATDNTGSLQEFVRRTFLSKPWLGADSIPQTALDTLSEKNIALKGWEEILDRQPLNRADVDYDDLVEKLINAQQP